jgi:hypothetical protein
MRAGPMQSGPSGRLDPMSHVARRLAPILARTGARLARRRADRARSLRWAGRVPVVTLTLAGVLVVFVLLAPAGSVRAGLR